MGWAEDYLAKTRGQENAAKAATPGFGESYTGGLISSIGSGLVESFGGRPFQSAQKFQEENPWTGGAASMLGGALPYIAMGPLSETAVGARALTGVLEKTGLNAATQSIKYGIAKEVVRYAPVEIARLGVGLATTDTWSDYGNLMADVGLSNLITGGFGGVGGFLRAGGKAAAEVGKINHPSMDTGFAPTFEYRLGRLPESTVTGEVPKDDVLNGLFREIMSETPAPVGMPGGFGKAPYVAGLEGGTPETTALVNSLFRPSGKKAGNQSLTRTPLMDRAGQWKIADAEKTELLGGLGFETMEDLAENVRFPRLVDVNSPSAAGVISKALDDSAMQWAGDGVMVGKETDGLFVVAKRLRAGEAENVGEAASKGVDDAGKIRAGDRWFITKTDKPQLFAPEAHKFAELTVNRFAMYRDAWRPSLSDDIFNAEANNLLKMHSTMDYKAAVTKPRWEAIKEISGRLAQKAVPGLEGTLSGETSRRLATAFVDSAVPTVVKEGKDSVYGRLWMLMRGMFRTGEERVNTMVGGKVQVKGNALMKRNMTHEEGMFGHKTIASLVNRLKPEERVMFKKISDAMGTKGSPDPLEAFGKEGLVSDNLREVVESVRNINRSAWEHDLMPAFKNAELDGKFDLLEGYIMPRLWTGDWFVPVIDDAGRTQWLANGTLGGAKAEANEMVAAAAEKGIKLKIDKPYPTGGKGKQSLSEIENLHDLMQTQLGQNADMQGVIQQALQRIAMKRSGHKGTAYKIGMPKTLTEERTRVLGSGNNPNLGDDITAADLINSMQAHYNSLYKFAAYSTWKRRFQPEAFNLSKVRPNLEQDLRLKADQMMGFESRQAQYLNKLLQPMLGSTMGGKAATKIAQTTNSLMYNWNLAIVNPTFALLNVLNPIQTTLPHLAFLLRAPMARVEQNMHMTMRYGADGLPREIVGTLSEAKILGRALKMAGNPDPELLELLGRMKTRGTINSQLFEGWVGGQSRAHETFKDAYHNAGGGVAGGWEFIKRVATFSSEKSEELSRLVAANSYYILGKEHFGLDPDRLLQFVERGVHNSMYGYSVVDRSRMFTGPVGSMFGLFKNWQLHFISSMAEYAGLAVKEGIYAPMLWQFGAAGALGGMGALGPLKWVADSLAKQSNGNPTAYSWMQENWAGAADEIYFGLPALFGASLQASSTLPGTDVRNDLSSLSSFVFIERAKQAGKAVGAAWDYAEGAGQNPLRDSNIRDKLLQGFAPRALFRAFSSVEGDYVKSMATGYPQVRDVSPLGKFLHGVGFNQLEVERQQVVAKELWKDQQARRTAISQLGIRLADAQLNGDYGDMERVNREIVISGLDSTKVYSSAQTRLRREQTSDVLSRFDPDLVAQYPGVR